MFKSRFISKPGAALCLALMLVTAAGGVATAAADPKPPATADQTVTAQEREAFRGGIRRGGETMPLLMDAFPDEYTAFETKVIVGVKAGELDMPAVQKMTYQWVMGLKARMMTNLSKASDADIVALGHAQVGLIGRLGKTYPRLCYEFVELGGPSQDTMLGLPHGVTAEIDKLGARQLRAAAAGLKAPVTRGPLTEADVTPVLAPFRKRGGDMTWLAAFGKPDALAKFTPEARCQNALIWTETILAQPAPVAAHLLAGQ